LSLAVTDLFTSDHCFVTFCLPLIKPPALQTKYTYRRWANFDIDEFDRELAASELATTDSLNVNYLFELYNATLRSTIDNARTAAADSRVLCSVLSAWH